MGDKIDGNVENRTEAGRNETTGNSSATRARARRARSTRVGQSRNRTTEEKEKLFKLASLKEKEIENREYLDKKEKYDKEIEKRKERKIAQNEPIALVSDNGELTEKEPVKKTRKRRTKKNTIDTEPIEKLLMTVTGIVATRPDMGMWKMSKQEAHAIAEPLVQVLEKYDLAKPIMDNAPEIALIVATLGFVAPRTVATITIKKETNKDGFKGKVISSGSTGKSLDENRKSDIIVERNDKKSATVVNLDDAFGSAL